MSVWIECLGGFALARGDAPLPLAARKAQVLLGLLACARRRTLPRARLAALLWEHAGEEGARTSLRQALAQIRRVAGPGLVMAEGEALRLGPEVSTDVGAMAEALARGDDAAAARRHAGPFLDGALPEGEALRAAVAAERVRLADLAAGALRRELARLGTHPEAAQPAHALLALDPLDEAAHRALIRADLAHGARGAARARYDALAAALARDLGTAPAPETRALMERSRPGGRRQDAAPQDEGGSALEGTALVAVALEDDVPLDPEALRAPVEGAAGRLEAGGPGEAALVWEGGDLRRAAGALLDLAEGAGRAQSFGLVEGPAGPRTTARARRVAARMGPGEVGLAPDLAARLGLAAEGSAPARLVREAAASRPELPLVGREAEIALIDAAIGLGGGIVVHLSGEAGIGKTRLAEEVARRRAAAGAHVIRIGFSPFAADAAPFARALMAALPAPEASADPVTEAVRGWLRGDVPSPEAELRLSAMSTEARRARLLEVLADGLRDAARAAPLLVAVEDCHWAPEGEDDLLLDLACALADAPVALLLTERPRDADLGHRLAARGRARLTRLALAPLADEAARRLAAIAAPEGGDHGAVLAHAAGHPLFLLRLLEAGWREGALPPTVTALVLEQIERLPAPERAALRHAAILGTAFDPHEFAALFPELPVPRPRGDLLHEEGGRLAFGHDLIRRAIYDALPPEARAEGHARAAAHLREVDPIRWAAHALRAEDDAEAARAAMAAANALIAAMRLRAAAAQVEAGLARAAGADGEVVAELHSARAGIRRVRGDLRSALGDYRAAHAAALTDATRVAMLTRQALVLHRLDRGPEADRALDDAEALADRIGLAGLARAEIHEQRGNRAFVAGDAAACLAQHRAGLAAAEATGDPRGIARAHGGLGDAHVLAGRLRTAHGHFERAVAGAAEAGLGLVHQEFAFMRGFTLLFAEPGPKAHLMCDLAVEAAAAAGADRPEMMALGVRGEVRLVALDLDGTARDIARFAELVSKDREARFTADVALMRAWHALRSGRPIDAFAAVSPHFEAARQSPYNGPAILALGALSAPDERTRRALADAADARVETGAMAFAAIGMHCFGLEIAGLLDDAARGARHLAALRAFAALEPLGLVDLAVRAGACRFEGRADPALRADLAKARAGGLASILASA